MYVRQSCHEDSQQTTDNSPVSRGAPLSSIMVDGIAHDYFCEAYLVIFLPEALRVVLPRLYYETDSVAIDSQCFAMVSESLC